MRYGGVMARVRASVAVGRGRRAGSEDEVGDDPFEQPGIGQHQWCGVVDLDADQVTGVDGGERGGEDLVVSDRAQYRLGGVDHQL
jgi:hypothetical protein